MQLFDFEYLLGSFLSRGEGAHECHEMTQIVFAELDVLIILDLRSDFPDDLLDELHFHDVFGHVWRDAQRPQKGIQEPQ